MFYHLPMNAVGHVVLIFLLSIAQSGNDALHRRGYFGVGLEKADSVRVSLQSRRIRRRLL